MTKFVRKISGYFLKMQFKRKILLFFLVLFMLYAIIGGLIIHLVIENVIKVKIINYISDTMEQGALSIENWMRNVEYIPVSLTSMPEIRNLVNITPYDRLSILDAQKKIRLERQQFDKIFSLSLGLNMYSISGITLFANNDITLNSTADFSIQEYKYSEAIKTDAFKKIKYAGGTPVWMVDKESVFNPNASNKNQIVCGRSIQYLLPDNEDNGIIIMNIRESYFREIYSKIVKGIGGEVFVVSRNGVVVSSPNEELNFKSIDINNNSISIDEAKTMQNFSILGEKYYAFSQPVKNSDWALVRLIPTTYISSETNSYLLLFVLVLLILFLLTAIIAIYLSNTITKPLKQLMHHMEHFDEENLTVSAFEFDNKNEFIYLQNSYNNMAYKMKDLIENIKDNAKDIRKSELIALQAQINPHFLYNVLDVIYWQINSKNYKNAEKMVIWLGKFYKLGLNSGNEITTLGNEIEQCESYLGINKIRYSEKMNYSIFIDEEIKQLKCMKFFVQPLIENALVHGIHPKEHGDIYVNAIKSDGGAIIEVYDNGVGISKEKIEDILNLKQIKNSTSASYAIVNVIERLKLYYNNTYKFEIFSEVGKCTTVRVFIPEKPQNQEIL